METDYVYGLAGIRELFKCSKATATKIKNTIIAPATHMEGRKIVTDKRQALELYSAWKIEKIEARQRKYEETRALRNERARISKAKARAERKAAALGK